MGAVFSFLKDVYFSLAMIRANASPGYPVPNPTSSFWQEDPPFPQLIDVQQDLPQEADVVIIGSGISAAAAAKSLLELAGTEQLRVVVLEARQLCSGATGRNGGHIKCTPYELFPRLRQKFGPEKARDIINFQLKHLKALQEVGAQFPLGQVREVETVDLYLYAEDLNKVKKDIDEAKPWFPEASFTVWEDADKIKEKFGVNDMIAGAVSYKAGALWPYRLVTSVWKDLVDRYSSLTLSMHTTVKEVSRTTGSTQYPYLVQSTRGTIKARHVLHATNAYAGQLLPSLRGSLTGALAHMTAQTPGDQFPQSNGDRSWSIIYLPAFDYITQLPDAKDGTPGHVMVGGGLARSKEQGLDQFGVWDDSRMDAFPTMHLHGAMATVFRPKWGRGASVDKAWTGILGFTGDSMPFVGQLPSSRSTAEKGGLKGSGEWISAGFNGEGMVWAWLCGGAVATMILGREEEHLEAGVGRPEGKLSSWFLAGDLAIDGQRLKRADLKNLANELNKRNRVIDFFVMSHGHPDSLIEAWRRSIPSRLEREDPFADDGFEMRPATRLTFRGLEDGMPPPGPANRPSTALGFFRAATPLFRRPSALMNRLTSHAEDPMNVDIAPKEPQRKRKGLMGIFSRKRKRSSPTPPAKFGEPLALNFLFVGGRCSGQTSLLYRIRYGVCPDTTAIPRTHFETYTVDRAYGNQPLRAELWDTSGAPDLRMVQRLSYISWDAIFLCFDVTDKMSMHTILQWASELLCLKKDARSLTPSESIQKLLPNAPHFAAFPTSCIRDTDIAWHAERIGAAAWFTCSARSGEGVEDVVEAVLGDATGCCAARAQVMDRMAAPRQRLF
ncbi:GTP-binding protein RHO1 [Paramyrothecium foliicola]|nr:GTP-binding protein RHO1 [Paramyrothecium foliicola]